MKHQLIRYIYAVILLLNGLTSYAQWIDHFSYAGCFYGGSNSKTAFAGNSLAWFIYDTEDFSIQRLSKANYLSSCGINTVQETEQSYLVGYNDGNIDIVNKSNLSVKNIPDIKNSTNITSKGINRFLKKGNRLYVAFKSGLVDIDLNRSDIKGYYRINTSTTNVNDVCLIGNTLMVATSTGLRIANVLSKRLEDTQEWRLFAETQASFCRLYVNGEDIFAVQGAIGQSCILYRVNITDGTLSIIRSIDTFEDMTFNDNKVVIATKNSLIITTYDALDSAQSLISAFLISKDGNTNKYTPDIRSISFINKDIISVTDASQGIVICDLSGNAESHIPNSPINSRAFELLCVGKDLYATSGGHNSSYEKMYYPAVIHVLHDDKWSAISSSAKDALHFCSGPSKPSSILVSTFGYGARQRDSQKASVIFNDYNSTLKNISTPGQVWNVCGAITFDYNGNLYVHNSFRSPGIKVRLADGTWTDGLPYYSINNTHSSNKMFCSSNNNIWFAPSRMDGNFGLTVFNVNDTPEDPSDDMYYSSRNMRDDPLFQGLLPEVDQDGEPLAKYFFAFAEDKNGVIWLGSGEGIYVFNHNKKLFTDKVGNISIDRIKIARNDGTNNADYLLSDDVIHAIVIDDNNRKWIGTDNNGLYLIGDDNSMLQHFTEDNSPLPSNTINSLALDKERGILYISSGSSGILAYKTFDTEKKSSIDKNLTIYPNPILPSYVGEVTIDGLAEDTDVRISDVQGRLVFRTTTTQSTLKWTLRVWGHGNRVTSGVYIVWAQTSDGKDEAVGKIVVVR